MRVGKVMVWFGAALAAVALLGGGLLFGGSMVSAQEPTPEVTQEADPAPESTAEPDATEEAAPGDGTDEEDGDERSKEECDRTDGSGSSTTGVRFGGGVRGLPQ